MISSVTMKQAPRIMIAGTNSGCGKTTVVCALLQALVNRGLDVASFKCGPDYIDPMFHSNIIGTDSMNVDLYFSGEEEARRLFARHAKQVNVIEGVMGFYDGLAMDSYEASAYHVSKALQTKVILVMNVHGMALSAAAMIKGFQTFRPDAHIAGVIFNRASESGYERLKKTVENECHIPVLGYLPTDPDISLESRYLGLITASEIEGLQEKMQKLAAQAEKTIDIDIILNMMQEAPDLQAYAPAIEKRGSFRLAVAKDKAFCFYYRANLELLEALGAEIVEFSPADDAELPDCDGLLLGGGYPELYADALEANAGMRKQIREAIEGGLPTLAECGGFMYLCRDIAGKAMCGLFNTSVHSTGKLTRFGYASFRAEEESLLFEHGAQIKGHEFHYWDADEPGSALRAEKPNGKTWRCGYVSDTLYAGYPHLYLPSCPKAAEGFADACIRYRERRTAR